MNCKTGDLAIIVGGKQPQNIGCMVEIIEPAGEIGWWRIRLMGAAISKSGRWATAGETGLAPDANLRPVRGPRKPDEVTTDRTIDEGVAA